MGKRLADLLKLQTGEYITLLVKDRNKTFNTIDLEIAGLVHTVNPNVNNYHVYLPLDLVQQALDVGNQVSKVVLRLADRSLAADLAGRLQNSLNKDHPNITVIPWNQMEALAFEDVSHLENQLILMITLLIAAIAIINTVILSALERMGEIGMMKAMGLQTREVVYTFVLESTGIASWAAWPVCSSERRQFGPSFLWHGLGCDDGRCGYDFLWHPGGWQNVWGWNPGPFSLFFSSLSLSLRSPVSYHPTGRRVKTVKAIDHH